jgi:precorrin-6x reductase
MATASRIAKQTAKTYQSVLLVRERAQDKLNALLSSQAAYTLIEHDETHPYYAQLKNAKRFVASSKINIE